MVAEVDKHVVERIRGILWPVEPDAVQLRIVAAEVGDQRVEVLTLAERGCQPAAVHLPAPPAGKPRLERESV